MIVKPSWRPDVTVGVVSGLLGVGFIVAAMQITPDPSTFNVIGPRVAPLTVGIATVFCSVALIVQDIRTSRRPQPPTPTSREDDRWVDGADTSVTDDPTADAAPETAASFSRILATFTLLAAYVVVFVPLGYLLSTFVFLAVLTGYSEPRKWLRNLLFAAGFTVLVYLLFTRGLRVQLPPGLLG